MAFNASEGLADDLLESALLSVQSSPTEFFRVLSGLDLMPAAFKVAVNALASAAANSDITANSDLTKQVAGYHALASSGHKLVIVAHSEGNFFANLAYTKLTSADANFVGVVGVAEPDSHVANDGPYITFRSDEIIDLVTTVRQQAGFRTLPPNADDFADPSYSNAYNHDFSLAYLAAASSLIFKDIDNVMNKLGDGTTTVATSTVPAGMTDVYQMSSEYDQFVAFNQTFTYNISDTHSRFSWTIEKQPPPVVTTTTNGTGSQAISVAMPVSGVDPNSGTITFCKNNSGWIPKKVIQSVKTNPPQSCKSPTTSQTYTTSLSLTPDGTFIFGRDESSDETYTCPIFNNPALTALFSDTSHRNKSIQYCYSSSKGNVSYSGIDELHLSNTGLNPSTQKGIVVVFNDDEMTTFTGNQSFVTIPSGNVTPELQFVGRVPTNLAPASCNASVTYNQ